VSQKVVERKGEWVALCKLGYGIGLKKWLARRRVLKKLFPKSPGGGNISLHVPFLSEIQLRSTDSILMYSRKNPELNSFDRRRRAPAPLLDFREQNGTKKHLIHSIHLIWHRLISSLRPRQATLSRTRIP
jgi:hypothetical protein